MINLDKVNQIKLNFTKPIKCQEYKNDANLLEKHGFAYRF